MTDQLIEELMELIRRVPDKYDDFIGGMESIMKKQDEEDIRSVIHFIKEDSTKMTDDIIEYLDELGI